jgi:hypothetical protein
MSRLFRFVAALVFLAGVVSFSLAWGKRQKSDTETARPFVAVFQESLLSAEGRLSIRGRRTRYVKANGEWKSVMRGANAAGEPEAYSPDQLDAAPGTKSAVMSGTADGVFIKGTEANERKWVGPQLSTEDTARYYSHRFLRTHPEFVRTDEVAGLGVYVLRTENPGYYWVEVSYSPLTGRNPLRIVHHQADGTEVRIEAVKVEFREVPEDINRDLMALPDGGNLHKDKR